MIICSLPSLPTAEKLRQGRGLSFVLVWLAVLGWDAGSWAQQASTLPLSTAAAHREGCFPYVEHVDSSCRLTDSEYGFRDSGDKETPEPRGIVAGVTSNRPVRLPDFLLKLPRLLEKGDKEYDGISGICANRGTKPEENDRHALIFKFIYSFVLVCMCAHGHVHMCGGQRSPADYDSSGAI